MKKYIKNKYFVPIAFVKKFEKISNEKNNKLILLLLILNICIIPNSISKVSERIENNKVIPTSNNINNNINNNKEKLVLLLKSINGNFNNIRVQNNKGYMEVDSIEEIYYMEEENVFKIHSVNIKENIIEVEVEL